MACQMTDVARKRLERGAVVEMRGTAPRLLDMTVWIGLGSRRLRPVMLCHASSARIVYGPV